MFDFNMTFPQKSSLFLPSTIHSWMFCMAMTIAVFLKVIPCHSWVVASSSGSHDEATLLLLWAGELEKLQKGDNGDSRIEAMQSILPDVGAEVFSQWTNTKRREVQRTTTASGFKRRLGVETLLRFFYQPKLWEMNCAWSAFRLYSTIVKHNFLLRLWLPLSRQQKAQQVTEHGRVHDGERLRCLFWESWHLMFF